MPVDHRRQTNVAGVYAIGDLSGQPMLAHKGSHEGLVAAAAGDHETARARLEDAVELFAASGASFELARARLELARVLASLGRADAAVREGATLGVECIVGGCPLMFCEPVDVGHRCLRWWLQRRGRVPR